ncbi:MAG: site-specific DNA-methyltransferase [Spirochaetota bacterium]
MPTEPLPRLDEETEVRNVLLSFCRLKPGEIWIDPVSGHKVGVLNAASRSDIVRIFESERSTLVINDPPYNITVGKKKSFALFHTNLEDYLAFSRKWVENALHIMADNSHLYIWLGADQNENFQPLPDFMIMMRNFKALKTRSYITVRNQRGYGTQKNWMCIRQELLYYVKGNPDFTVVYTEIPKVLKGYYKVIKGKLTENLERSKSETIRPGNVWLDIQQVFYRMEENVPGAYAQKPLTAIERIILSSSQAGDTVADFFSHSGTTLIAAERLNRKCITLDCDPLFAELTIRRLEHYRKTGKRGWQYAHPFPEIEGTVYPANKS